MTSKGKSNRKSNKKTSVENIAQSKVSTVESSDQVSATTQNELILSNIQKAIEVDQKIFPAKIDDRSSSSTEQVTKIASTAPSTSALNTPSGSKVFQYDDAYVGSENEDIDYYVPDKQFLNDSTVSPSDLDRSVIITDIYTNNVLSPLRESSEGELTNPSFAVTFDKPPHPITSFASPGANKPSKVVAASRSADSLASEDLTGIWRDVSGDDSNDESNGTHTAGIALTTSPDSLTSSPVQSVVGVATASRITTADVIQSVGLNGIDSSPLHHSESGSDLQGTFIEKKQSVTISVTLRAATSDSPVEMEAPITAEQTTTEWKTFNTEVSTEDAGDCLSEQTAVERVAEGVHEVLGCIRSVLDTVSGKSSESSATTVSVFSTSQLLQTAVNVALFLPSLLMRVYVWLLMSFFSAVSTAVSMGCNAIFAVVCAPFNLAKYIVRSLVSMAVSFLNQTPAGRFIPTVNSNGQVVERY